MTRDLWYKEAVIYCLNVDTFQDSNDDGIGDFQGLIERLDYLSGLGPNCLWLMPFYPSPNRDHGYDVTDYYDIDPRLGTLGDFVEFMHRARERGLRVIIDLPVNHTSRQHPWFQMARSSRDSPYRDYYVWSDTKPEGAHEGMVFPGPQDAIWTYDEEADAHYLHRFYSHEPDLNIANEEVRAEIKKIMGFWLELGVSGFRLDAAPFLVGMKGIDEPGVSDRYEYLREFRQFLSWRRGDAVLLAEANVPGEEIPEYFGAGTRMHMLFNFLVNQHLFLSLAREDSRPLESVLRKMPDIPEEGQWANFLRNHDELDLGRLSEFDRAEVFQRFAPEEEMHVYGRGIRRRLLPMLDGDESQLRLAYSLLLSLPGSPVIRYGQEIGMGDNLSLPERSPVRTPMQWSDDVNGGFSDASSEDLRHPMISEGPYRYEKVNVAKQRQDPDSLLNWMERMIRMRKECPEYGWGNCTIMEVENSAVFAHRCQWRGGDVLAVHNLTGEPQTVHLAIGELAAGDHLIDLLANRQYQSVGEDHREIELDSYGYRWFRLRGTYT